MKKMIFATSIVFSLFTSSAVLAETININTADAAALDALDGIGEKKAEAIIAYRTEHGEFKTLEDLKEVPGIGDKMFEKIKADIALADADAPATDKTAKADTTAAGKAPAQAEVKTEAKADVKATDKADEKAEATTKTDKVSTNTVNKENKS
jgi:competence protein ComEA